MGDIINNRQVNLWRGTQEPPTKYHIWIKDNKLLLYDGSEWIVFIDHFDTILDIEEVKKQIDLLKGLTVNNKKIIDNPVLNSLDILVGKDLTSILGTDSVFRALQILDEKQKEGYSITLNLNPDSSITVNIGDHLFTLYGENAIDLSIAKDNKIIIKSNALTSINTEAPLSWERKTNTLTHDKSGVTAGNYGVNSDLKGVNTFTVPGISVDETGHVTFIKNSLVTIRDYVLLETDLETNLDRPILTSYGETSLANPVVKANNLTFNNVTNNLNIPGTVVIGGKVTVNGGDLEVAKGHKIIGDLEGSISGTATPKIHLAKDTTYGAASKLLYGHVLLEDVLGTEAPLPSNTNEDVNTKDLPESTLSVAASPLMVWNTKEDLKKYMVSLFGEDFLKNEDNKFDIKWENIK